MSERDTKLFEVLIGQIAKDGGVDVTLGKALRVLGHAELFEPVGAHATELTMRSGYQKIVSNAAARAEISPMNEPAEGSFTSDWNFPAVFPFADAMEI